MYKRQLLFLVKLPAAPSGAARAESVLRLSLLHIFRYAHRFCAVDTPVYYYVKNEKSIPHTQIDLVGVVKTKAKLFTYYKGLYESLGLYENCLLYTSRCV